MARYILQRLLLSLPVLLLVVTLSFIIFYVIPGDPALLMVSPDASYAEVEALRRALGLTDPLYVQYFRYLGEVVRLDFGSSLRTGLPVLEEIQVRYPNTFLLAGAGMLIAVVLGLAAGLISAARHNTWLDRLLTLLVLVGVSTPVFWLGFILMLIFSATLLWLPSGGTGTIAHLILPAATLGLHSTADIARVTRASMLEVLRQDYIRTARAKGVREFLVLNWHGLRNALIPIVTMIGIRFGTLLGGVVLVENVFAWPGIGRLMVDALRVRDYPVVHGAALLLAVTVVVLNLLVDLSYARLDPRVRFD